MPNGDKHESSGWWYAAAGLATYAAGRVAEWCFRFRSTRHSERRQIRSDAIAEWRDLVERIWKDSAEKQQQIEERDATIMTLSRRNAVLEYERDNLRAQLHSLGDKRCPLLSDPDIHVGVDAEDMEIARRQQAQSTLLLGEEVKHMDTVQPEAGDEHPADRGQ